MPVFKQNFLRPFPLLLNFCFWSMIFSWSCLNTDMQRIKHYIVLKYYSLWLRNVTIVYHSGIQKSTTIFPLHKNSLTDRIYASLCTHALSARLVLLLLSRAVHSGPRTNVLYCLLTQAGPSLMALEKQMPPSASLVFLLCSLYHAVSQTANR